MSDHLAEAYQAADYRVRRPAGGCSSIRIGALLPDDLQTLCGDHAWGLITAWNPRSVVCSRQRNREAQRQLLADVKLRWLPRQIIGSVGIGSDGWSEYGLFLIDCDQASLLTLARRYDQHAVVHGAPSDIARLHWTSDSALAH